MKPLAIDLYCGLGGWTEGLLAEGYDVIGFDIEQHAYALPDYADDGGNGNKGTAKVKNRGWTASTAIGLGLESHLASGLKPRPATRIARYPAQLVLQDVLTLHGSQFKDAALIVASPPCQEYSYMAMPWSRAKAIQAEYRSGVRDVKQLTALFDACFRIQREAIEAAGHFIPLVVENVRGAIPWVGRSRWNYGSFHLWGDVPALMPMAKALKVAGFRFDGSGRSFQSESVDRHTKNTGGSWFNIANNQTSGRGRNPDGRKQPGISGPRENGKGDRWFQDGAAIYGSKSSKRKAASAMIAKIPLVLARHIAYIYYPGVNV